MAVILGRTSASTTADNIPAGDAVSWRFAANFTGLVWSIWMQTKVANPGLTSVELGIYTDGGAGVGPITRLGSAQATGFTGTTAFSAVLSSPVSVTSGTFYWLAAQPDGEQFDWQGDAAANYNQLAVGGALPATWSGGSFFNNLGIIWAEDTPPVSNVRRPLLEKLVQRGKQRALAIRRLQPTQDTLAYDAVVTADAAVGHYKLAEPSGATMNARIGPAGTYTSTITQGVPGLLIAGNGGSTAVSFLRPSGTAGGYAAVAQADAEAVFDGTTQFSLECWLTPISDTARSSNQNLLDRATYGLYLTADNKPGIFYGAAGTTTSNASTALLAGTTYHLVYTFDGTTHTVYVNSVSVISVADVRVAGGAFGIANYPGGFDTANVTMDEVAVYRAALTPAQVLTHFLTGGGVVAAGGPAIIPLQTSAAVSTATLAVTAQTGIALGTAAAQSAATLALTAQTQVPLAASAAQSTATLALTAPTQIPLQASAAVSTATLTVTAGSPGQIPLDPAAVVSTATLALTAKTQVPLGTAAATTSATLALTAQTTVPLASSTATSTATLALTAQTRVALGTAAAQSSATLALTAQTSIPLAASAATSTATLALTAQTRVALGTAAAQSSATLALTAQTYIPLQASTATSAATLSVTAGPGVIGFQPSAATSSATLALAAQTRVTLSTSAAASSATLTVSTPTQTFIPLNAAAAVSTGTLALKAQTRVTLQTATATTTASLALFTPTAALIVLGAANANSTGGVLQMVQMGGRWPAHTNTRWDIDPETHWQHTSEPRWASTPASSRWDVDPQPHW